MEITQISIISFIMSKRSDRRHKHQARKKARFDRKVRGIFPVPPANKSIANQRQDLGFA